nr:PEP-CTERM sorting domain-containing protein [uncultured Roseateles sp.]
MKTSNKTLIAAAALALTGLAGAATTQIKYVKEDPAGLSVNVTGSDDTTVGRMLFATQGGPSFYAYCVELAQPASTSFHSYTIGSFAGAQAKNLEGLFSATSLYTGDKKIDTAVEYAAFQVAVWEITHETGKTLDVAGYESRQVTTTTGHGRNQHTTTSTVWDSNTDRGSFYVQDYLGSGYSNSNGKTAAFAGLANSYLNDAVNYSGRDLFTVTKLSNGSYQDYVTVSALPVPEPTSYALMMAGLLALGFVSARRRQSRA